MFFCNVPEDLHDSFVVSFCNEVLGRLLEADHGHTQNEHGKYKRRRRTPYITPRLIVLASAADGFSTREIRVKCQGKKTGDELTQT